MVRVMRLLAVVALVAGVAAACTVPAGRARGARPAHARRLGGGAHQDLGRRLPGQRAAPALHRERLGGRSSPG